ncbi:OmpH family outer membrane protein [Caulobacter soli]|uniref:OmpH family outer membrane protein n=1 Tax=Caulobacter soli TaxID=2708539 RepID=UPI0013EB1DFA|nr:OmpH family outer membrane protein [Caulobacter soli]
MIEWRGIFRRAGHVAAGVVALGGLYGSAHAQARPQPVRIAYGAAPAGVCLFSLSMALGGSRAGQDGTQRLQQLQASIKTELDQEEGAILAQTRTLQAQSKTMPAGQYQQAAAQLQQRAQAFLRLRQTRENQIVQTRVNAERQISAAINPILSNLVTARQCGVLLDRGAAYGFNGNADLTSDVIQRVNVSLPQVQVVLAPPTAAP